MNKEILLQRLKDYYKQYGKAPVKNNYSNVVTIIKYFGSWNNALKEAEIPINREQQIARPIVACAACNKPTKNARFCCRACANSVTNKERLRKHKSLPKLCKQCSVNVVTQSRTLCDDCGKKVDNMTLGELKYKYNDSRKYEKIRGRARTFYKNEIKQGCEKCGYTRHAEVAHIKSIGSFPNDTLVKDINSRSNIYILCPNCHWELDYGGAS